jgi:hypothetical protein
MAIKLLQSVSKGCQRYQSRAPSIIRRPDWFSQTAKQIIATVNLPTLCLVVRQCGLAASAFAVLGKGSFTKGKVLSLREKIFPIHHYFQRPNPFPGCVLITSSINAYGILADLMKPIGTHIAKDEPILRSESMGAKDRVGCRPWRATEDACSAYIGLGSQLVRFPPVVVFGSTSSFWH